jgi:hypothetical protein
MQTKAFWTNTGTDRVPALTLVADLLLLALSAHHELDEALGGVLVSHVKLKGLLPGGVQA